MSDVATERKPSQAELDVATKPLHAKIEKLQEAIVMILAEPHGCPMCDSGKLRSPNKPHWTTCGFGRAHALMATKV